MKEKKSSFAKRKNLAEKPGLRQKTGKRPKKSAVKKAISGERNQNRLTMKRRTSSIKRRSKKTSKGSLRAKNPSTRKKRTKAKSGQVVQGSKRRSRLNKNDKILN